MSSLTFLHQAIKKFSRSGICTKYQSNSLELALLEKQKGISSFNKLFLATSAAEDK